MLKKTITFLDLDGNPVTEDFYFHLTTSDIVEMNFLADGKDLTTYIEEIQRTEDAKKVLQLFKDIIRASIGERSANNQRFIRSDEIAENFLQSDAFSEFFMSALQEPRVMSDFVTALIPKDIDKQRGRVEQGAARVQPQDRLPSRKDRRGNGDYEPVNAPPMSPEVPQDTPPVSPAAPEESQEEELARLRRQLAERDDA